jgi:hypothetical protein
MDKAKLTEELNQSKDKLQTSLNAFKQLEIKYRNTPFLDSYGKMKKEKKELLNLQDLEVKIMIDEIQALDIKQIEADEKISYIFSELPELYKLTREVMDEIDGFFTERNQYWDKEEEYRISEELAEKKKERREERESNYTPPDAEARIMRNLREGRGDLEGF